jgi:hypothetical protein
MASTMRSVDTKFWSDIWVRKLNALDRYAFLYFLTNEHSTWCGVYEVDLAMIAFESGIDEQDLKNSIMPRLEPKIIYVDGWVYIKNFEKYHGNRSILTQKGIDIAWSKVPDEIRLKIKGYDKNSIPHARGIQGVSPSASALSSSLALSIASKEGGTPAQDCRSFFNGEGVYRELLDTMSKDRQKEIIEKEFQKFTLYWTEPNGTGKKVRWEQQPTFDVKRRLLTWMARVNDFTKTNNKQILI